MQAENVMAAEKQQANSYARYATTTVERGAMQLHKEPYVCRPYVHGVTQPAHKPAARDVTQEEQKRCRVARKF